MEKVFFIDWYEQGAEKKNIESSFIDKGGMQNLESLRACTISSHKRFWFRCQKCGKEFEREIRQITRNKNKEILCEKCSRVHKTEKSVYEWTKTEGMKRHIEIEGIEDAELKSIYVNSRKELRFTCKIHQESFKRVIRSVCGSDKEQYELPCCRRAFTFQDWCLLFYNYIFVGICKDKKKCYTGKQLRMYFNNANSYRLFSDRELLFSDSRKEYEFCCDKSTKRKFKRNLKSITCCSEWCTENGNSKMYKCGECEEITNLIAGKKHIPMDKVSIETFIERYPVTGALYTRYERRLQEAVNEKEQKAFEFVLKREKGSYESVSTLVNEIRMRDRAVMQMIVKILKVHESRKMPRKKYIGKAQIIREITNRKAEFSNISNNKEYIRQFEERELTMGLPQNSGWIIIVLGSAIGCEYDYVITDYHRENNNRNMKLCGRPVILKEEIREQILADGSYVGINYGYCDEEWFEEGYRDRIQLNKLSPLIEGVSADSFNNRVFDSNEQLPESIKYLEEGSFRGCQYADGFTIPSHVLSMVASAGLFSTGENVQMYIQRTGKFGLNYIKMSNPVSGMIQYRSLLKMGENICISADRITVETNEKQYVLLDNFSWEKFYEDEDILALNLIFGHYKIAPITDVTVGILDIYYNREFRDFA